MMNGTSHTKLLSGTEGTCLCGRYSLYFLTNVILTVIIVNDHQAADYWCIFVSIQKIAIISLVACDRKVSYFYCKDPINEQMRRNDLYLIKKNYAKADRSMIWIQYDLNNKLFIARPEDNNFDSERRRPKK